LLLPVATGKYTRNRLLLATFLAIPGAFALTSGEAAELATSRYIGNGNEAAGAIFRVGVLGLSAMHFFLFLSKKWQQTKQKEYNLASIGAVGMALAFLLIPVSTVIADRLGYYLIPIQVMIFARIPILPLQINARLHATLPYLGLALVFAVWTQLSWHFKQCYIPYQSWFFGFPGGGPFQF